MIYDLALATDWEYDFDFIDLIKTRARLVGLTTTIIRADNLDFIIQQLENHSVQFRVLFDRASDTSPDFLRLQNHIQNHGGCVIEPVSRMKWASDKATMHLEFLQAGIRTPFTVILPPWIEKKDVFLSLSELAQLDRPFVAKPANTTGGSTGVMENVEAFEDVLDTRIHLPRDKYLLQKKVVSLEKDGKRFWFRGFFVFDEVFCVWWHNQIHTYELLSAEEIETYGLLPIFEIIHKIAEVCKLRFFSTEIAVTEEEGFVVVDYVNESCDMRLKSKYSDGVPDTLVESMVRRIVDFIKEL
jgi:glutathione synthase/RimK-type ligase-like ATP-grasp enzyme